MPIGPVFLGWVQDHQEAREIYRSVRNFQSDRELAKELAVPATLTHVSEWEEQVRANCQRGWRADWIERKYIPPDWNKVYPLLGGPPVWSTENMQAYNALLGEFTQMLQPCDLMELIWTKEAADATWELGREAREKNAVPERQYQLRLINDALAKRQARVKADPATARDHSLGLRAGFKYHQGLDVAQSRAMKRRDNALRQIARWRDGLGGKAQALSDKFIAEQTLAERYGVDQFLADAEIDDTVGEVIEAAPPLVPSGEIAQTLPAPASAGEVPVPPMDATAGVASSIGASGETAKAAPPLAPAGGIAEAVPPVDPALDAAEAGPSLAGAGESALAPTDGTAKVVPPPAPTGEIAEAVPPVDPAVGAAQAAAPLACAGEPALAPADDGAKAVPPLAPAGEVAHAAPSGGSSGETAEAARSVALPDEAAEAAPTRAPAGEVDWVAWLTGAERYRWVVLQEGAQKKFKQAFMSQKSLVRHLVLDRKLIRPDQVCPELAQYLPATA
jgi:hypothetical protein